jgi:hypothetical protein
VEVAAAVLVGKTQTLLLVAQIQAVAVAVLVAVLHPGKKEKMVAQVS